MSQLNKTISYRGVQLSVDYTYYPPSRGAREHGTGLQLEPDEDASVDIDDVKLEYQEEEADGGCFGLADLGDDAGPLADDGDELPIGLVDATSQGVEIGGPIGR